MPSEDSGAPFEGIAQGLRAHYQDMLEAPLPPLILQLLRQLRDKTEPETDTGEEGGSRPDGPAPQRKRADLFLPGAREEWWRQP
jgi:hypothetical protein